MWTYITELKIRNLLSSVGGAYEIACCLCNSCKMRQIHRKFKEGTVSPGFFVTKLTPGEYIIHADLSSRAICLTSFSLLVAYKRFHNMYHTSYEFGGNF